MDDSDFAAAVVSDLVKASFESIIGKFGGVASNVRALLFEDFDQFMQETYRKNVRVRVLCQKDRDVNFDQVYVPAKFKCGKQVLSDVKLDVLAGECRRLIIVGNGGAGKTFFMRHLWMTFFRNKLPKAPILIELRKLSDQVKVDLASYIRATISKNGRLSGSVFTELCRNGRFLFILDGYDEVSENRRDDLQSQILEMSASYPDCGFVVSSRPDDAFAGWQGFDVFRSMPFTLDQVADLIKKLPFDPNVKTAFLEKLDNSYFKKHEAFLSSPLLSVMMLMTFSDNMDIPSKMTNFFDQAFNTLYNWHDATKTYKRKKNLSIDDFQRSFGMFSFISYLDEKIEYSRSELMAAIRLSNNATGIEVNEENIVTDYEVSVSLLRQEGLYYTFIHKTFQEYFTSLQISKISPSLFRDILPKITAASSDYVFPMCYELSPDLVMSEYIIPEYKHFRDLGVFESIGIYESYRVPTYSLLERVSASYTFHFGVYQDATLARLQVEESVALFPLYIGASSSMDARLRVFIDSIIRIKDKRPIGDRDGVANRLFSSKFPGACKTKWADKSNTMARRVEGEKIILKLSFKNGEPIFEISKSTICASLVVDEGDLFIADALMAVLDELAKNTKEILRQSYEWCAKEVRKTETRGKSIREILEYRNLD